MSETNSNTLRENIGNFRQESGPKYKQLDDNFGIASTRIECSHDDINLQNGFKGKECRLKTSHGTIYIGKSVMARQIIELNTSHKDIKVNGSLLSHKDIRIKSSHGSLRMSKGASIVSQLFEVKTTHAPLLLDNSVIDAKNVKLETTHNRIVVNNASFENEFIAKSTHGPIDLHIKAIYSDSAKIKATTSHGSVNIYLPSDFSGLFKIKTSKTEEANVTSRVLDDIEVNYTKNSKSEKVGTILYLGNKSNAEVRVETSTKPVNLYIGERALY